MRKAKDIISGFICFLATSAFNIGMGVMVYSKIEDEKNSSIALFIFLLILINALLFTIIDYIRRRFMISRPLKEILVATELLSRGNFKVRLIPNHEYSDYDEFDLIKEEINNVAKELSKNEMLKNDFIANVSHEIKTPLSIISSYAKALNNENLDLETKKKYLSTLQESCKKLSDLVTNILKLNKLENQKHLPETTNFNLSESLANQILQFEELIERKNISLECDIQDDLYINSKESYLNIVWNNLMSNAIKFTPEKGIIKVSLNKINDTYVIKFSDTGCGMDKKTGEQIFDKFYQGETSHIKEGNGLGLALVKKVVDILGGSIRVESQINEGATFTITIKEV